MVVAVVRETFEPSGRVTEAVTVPGLAAAPDESTVSQVK